MVGGAPATTPARLVAPGESVAVTGPPPRYVGRGGHKLEAALGRFDLRVDGCRALDAGSSTGGFTDCLLQAGAARVVAVDVGRGQLHHRLATDDRVEVRERTDIRTLVAADIGGPVDLVVADLSFLSLRLVVDALLGLARPAAPMVLLVKPQFEAERAVVRAGRGVITEPDVWRDCLRQVIGALQGRGAAIMDLMVSPLRGADGNVEFLLHAQAPGPDTPTSPPAGSVDRLIEHVVGEAAGS